MSEPSIKELRGKGINWAVLSFLIAFHILAVAALFMFTWKGLIAGVVMYWIAGSLGIGVGYHRLLTHRGYKASKPVEYFLTICGNLALEGGPGAWVATHRIHHKYTDKAGDPHSPRDGKWWSHMAWIYSGNSLEHSKEGMTKYAPDLMRSRFHVWMTDWYWVPFTISAILLLVFGGWSVLLWGAFVRTVAAWHSTWLVNSATHLWGTQRFKTTDDSKNSFWVALLSFGEGWHNNHHAHPVSARHGLTWYEIDTNWYVIKVMSWLGLLKDIKVAKLKQELPAIETSLTRPLVATTEA